MGKNTIAIHASEGTNQGCIAEYFTDNKECKGNLEKLLLAASKQRAGKLTLLNTNQWLVNHVITRGLHKTRQTKLR